MPFPIGYRSIISDGNFTRPWRGRQVEHAGYVVQRGIVPQGEAAEGCAEVLQGEPPDDLVSDYILVVVPGSNEVVLQGDGENG